MTLLAASSVRVSADPFDSFEEPFSALGHTGLDPLRLQNVDFMHKLIAVCTLGLQVLLCPVSFRSSFIPANSRQHFIVAHLNSDEDVQALRSSEEAADFSILLRRCEKIAAEAKMDGFGQVATYLIKDFRNFLAHGR